MERSGMGREGVGKARKGWESELKEQEVIGRNRKGMNCTEKDKKGWKVMRMVRKGWKSMTRERVGSWSSVSANSVFWHLFCPKGAKRQDFYCICIYL